MYGKCLNCGCDFKIEDIKVGDFEIRCVCERCGSSFDAESIKGIDWMDYIIDSLLNYPEGNIWSNGNDEILCKTEVIANCIADLLKRLYRVYNDKEILVHTGYYDLEEDKRNNEEDKYTGWWYVNIYE